MNMINKTAVALAFTVVSSMALAQTVSQPETVDCDIPLSVVSSYCGSDSACVAQVQSSHPECFPGGAVASSTVINATVFSQAVSISRSISARPVIASGRPAGRPASAIGTAAAMQTGIAAGGSMQSINVWGNVNKSNTDIGYTNTAGARTTGSTDVVNAVFGADYAMSPQMVLGVSVGIDDGDGSSGLNAKTSTEGYVVAPYIGYQLSKDLYLDASAGIGSADYSASGNVTADVDRKFFALNLSRNHWLGELQLTEKFSYLNGEEKSGNARTAGVVNPNTSMKNTVDQVRLGIQAGYWMDSLMPVAGLSYASDVGRSSSTGSNPLGRNAVVGSLGVNFFSLSGKVTGGVVYEREWKRSNSKNEVLNANVNFRF